MLKRILLQDVRTDLFILLPVFQSEASEWRKVFFISIAFYILSNLFYLLFISGDVQSWNEPKQIEGGGWYYVYIYLTL